MQTKKEQRKDAIKNATLYYKKNAVIFNLIAGSESWRSSWEQLLLKIDK